MFLSRVASAQPFFSVYTGRGGRCGVVCTRCSSFRARLYTIPRNREAAVIAADLQFPVPRYSINRPAWAHACSHA